MKKSRFGIPTKQLIPRFNSILCVISLGFTSEIFTIVQTEILLLATRFYISICASDEAETLSIILGANWYTAICRLAFLIILRNDYFKNLLKGYDFHVVLSREQSIFGKSYGLNNKNLPPPSKSLTEK